MPKPLVPFLSMCKLISSASDNHTHTHKASTETVAVRVCHGLMCFHLLQLNCRYFKRLIKKFKHKEETEEDVYTRWEKDFDLVPQSNQGLFSEYLELGVFFIYIYIYTCMLLTDLKPGLEATGQL